MRPKNLLKLANEVILSPDKRAAYNVNTGQGTPDFGFFLELLSERHPVVDQGAIRDFWIKNYKLFHRENIFLGIWWDGDSWVYGAAELIESLATATAKAYKLGTQFIFDNETGETLEVTPIGV